MRGADRGIEKHTEGILGGEHADMKIEERYRKGKEDTKSGEWGHETWRCYAFHTYFIDTVYIHYMYTLHTLYRSHVQLCSYIHVCTYVREEKNGGNVEDRKKHTRGTRGRQRFGKGDGEMTEEMTGQRRRSTERQMGSMEGKCRDSDTAADAVSSLRMGRGTEGKREKSTDRGSANYGSEPKSARHQLHQ